VKLWNVLSGELIHNFGGHTGFVSCVKLLELSSELNKFLIYTVNYFYKSWWELLNFYEPKRKELSIDRLEIQIALTFK